jgi:DNA-damage-inducible protein D
VSNIKLFQSRRIRSTWNEEEQQWYFSIVDVVGALTDSSNPTDYLKKMRKRDEKLASYLGTNCPQVPMATETGKKRLTLAGTTKDILRIIQSIPSSKAEPFKIWLAQVGSERIAEISKATFGLTPTEYKKLKSIERPSENLRDHMTDLELLFSALGEASTTEIAKTHDAQGMQENTSAAQEDGKIARDARHALEKKTGHSVISKQNYKQLDEKDIRKKLKSKN